MLAPLLLSPTLTELRSSPLQQCMWRSDGLEKLEVAERHSALVSPLSVTSHSSPTTLVTGKLRTCYGFVSVSYHVVSIYISGGLCSSELQHREWICERCLNTILHYSVKAQCNITWHITRLPLTEETISTCPDSPDPRSFPPIFPQSLRSQRQARDKSVTSLRACQRQVADKSVTSCRLVSEK